MAAVLKTCSCLRVAGIAVRKTILLPTPLVVNHSVPQRNFKAKWVAPTLRALKARKDAEDLDAGGEKIFHRSTFLEWLDDFFTFFPCFHS